MFIIFLFLYSPVPNAYFSTFPSETLKTASSPPRDTNTEEIKTDIKDELEDILMDDLADSEFLALDVDNIINGGSNSSMTSDGVTSSDVTADAVMANNADSMTVSNLEDCTDSELLALDVDQLTSVTTAGVTAGVNHSIVTSSSVTINSDSVTDSGISNVNVSSSLPVQSQSSSPSTSTITLSDSSGIDGELSTHNPRVLPGRSSNIEESQSSTTSSTTASLSDSVASEGSATVDILTQLNGEPSGVMSSSTLSSSQVTSTQSSTTPSGATTGDGSSQETSSSNQTVNKQETTWISCEVNT